MSANDQLSRMAVALNNIGITLLERQCYHDASLTLKDAVSLIKTCGNRNTHAGKDMKDMKDVMHRAHKRLAASPQCNKIGCICFEIITDTYCASKMGSVLSEESKSKAFIVRVEDSCHTTEFSTAILIHNFGMSYLAMGKSSKTRRLKSRHGESALKLFRIANSIFAKGIQKGGESSIHFIHISVVIISTLISTLRENKQHNEATVFGTMLDRLRSTIHQSSIVLRAGCTAAAAA